MVAEGPQTLGVVYLKDVVKGGIKERFAELRRMGIRTVMITGDNVLTATAIAAEMASQVLVVTTPDVLALRGVRRMRELWKRLAVREDEDVKIVLNQASRRREIQPDLARKVVGDTMTQTTIPADFNALEAARAFAYDSQLGPANHLGYEIVAFIDPSGRGDPPGSLALAGRAIPVESIGPEARGLPTWLGQPHVVVALELEEMARREAFIESLSLRYGGI